MGSLKRNKRLTFVMLSVMILSMLSFNTLATEQAKGSEQIVTFTIGQQDYQKGTQNVTTDVAPYIKDDRTLVPVAFVAPALGTDSAVWLPEEQTVRISRDDDLIIIKIGSKQLNVNGKILMMDTAAEIKDIGGGGGRTMLPISFLAKALSVGYEWNDSTRSVDFYGYSETYDEEGIYGPTQGSETIAGNVTVAAADVRLQNKVIKGNLIIAESVGDGDVFLENISVLGDTFVRGGGKNSIHINGGSFRGNLVIESTPDGGTRVVTTNAQGVNVVVATGQAGEEVILEGTFSNVEVTAADAVVSTQGQTTIENIVVNNTATVTVAEGTKVTTVTLNKAATVKGDGEVTTANVNADDVVISTTTQPNVNTAPGVEPPANEPATTPPSSNDTSYVGGGGGSSDDSSDEPTVVAVTSVSVTPTTLSLTAGGATGTITASVSPANATNINVTWSSSAANVATVASGVVTPVAAGTANITATSAADATKTATAAVTVKAATTATPIDDGASNPNTVIGLTGDTYAAGATTEANWTIDTGTTGLTVDNISLHDAPGTATSATFDFTGTAAPGTLSIQPNATALTSEIAGNAVSIGIAAADPVDITAAAVVITAPVLGETPQDTAAVEAATSNADFIVTNVTWNEDLTAGSKFKAATVYTATLELTSKNAKEFQSAAFTPTVASADSVGTTTTTGTGVGNTVSFTVTFAETGALAVDSIAVTTQPTKMSYTETTDDTLALDGMVITETNNDGSTATATFTDGTAVGYTANPANGSTLTAASHNGNPVTITHDATGKTAATNNLTVTAAAAPATPSTPTLASRTEDTVVLACSAEENLADLEYAMSIYNDVTGVWPEFWWGDSLTNVIEGLDPGTQHRFAARFKAAGGQPASEPSGFIEVTTLELGAEITGLDTPANVLQIGEVLTRTASTTEAGTLSWTSSNETAATIDSSSRVVTAQAPGTTVIRYIVGEVTNKVEIQVFALATIDHPSIGVVQVDEDDVAPTEFTSAAGGQTIQWQSSDTSKATVNTGTGVITAVAPGDTTISYQVLEDSTGRVVAKGQQLITVHEAATVDTFEIGTVQLGAGDVTPTGFTPAASGQTIQWQSSDTSKATVNTGTGVITAVAPGDTIISYRVIDDSTGKTIVKGQLSITVLGSAYGSGIEADPWKISKIEDLASIGQTHAASGQAWELDDYYILMNNLDFSADSSYTDPAATGTDWNGDGNSSESIKTQFTTGVGWLPITDCDTTQFSGSFDGNGKTISNLFINRPTEDYQALFGATSGAVISDLGLLDVNVTGSGEVAALVADVLDTYISFCYSTGSVVGDGMYLGGLVGWFSGSSVDPTIKYSYSTVGVTGTGTSANHVGGLAGGIYDGAQIHASYAAGNVSGYNNVGGLVGDVYQGFDGYDQTGNAAIKNAYATGDVTGNNNVGGLAGSIEWDVLVYKSYATGSVSGVDSVGGIVGVYSQVAGDNCRIIDQLAFNPSVAGTTNVHRILGSSTSGVSEGGSQLDRNYANQNMTVNGSAISSTEHWNLDGYDIADMTSTGTAPLLYWEFDYDDDTDGTYWKIVAGITRPILFVDYDGTFIQLGEQ